MKVAVAGCLGRMGSALIEAIQADNRFQLTAASERADVDVTDAQTQMAAFGCGNLMISSDVHAVAKAADAVIDFTTPEATLAMAEAVAARGGIHVIGTTGFSAAQLDMLKTYGKKARIVQSGNFSLGINLLEALVEEAARILDDIYDIEIFEMHHQHKKDAPSGTALMLAEAAARGRDVVLADKKKLDRNGERARGDIGFSVSRGGDVVGIHHVAFAGPGEMIELKHQGFSRNIYVAGALHAAKWARDKKPGFYSMKDVLSN